MDKSNIFINNIPIDKINVSFINFLNELLPTTTADRLTSLAVENSSIGRERLLLTDVACTTSSTIGVGYLSDAHNGVGLVVDRSRVRLSAEHSRVSTCKGDRLWVGKPLSHPGM